jgi:hypothetical protein
MVAYLSLVQPYSVLTVVARLLYRQSGDVVGDVHVERERGAYVAWRLAYDEWLFREASALELDDDEG